MNTESHKPSTLKVIQNGLDLIFSSYDEDDDDGEDEDKNDNNNHRNANDSNDLKEGSTALQNSNKRLKLESDAGEVIAVENNLDSHLPVPDALKNMYLPSVVNLNDDPELHQGRTRSFPHARGNWVSYVHINFSENEAIIALAGWTVSAVKRLKPPSQVYINSEFHLSLTKTQIFRHHWINTFISSLKEKLKTHKSFDVVFDTVEIYVNEDKTRTFIGLEAFSSQNLLHLVADNDSCLSDYDLLPYYDNASFHVSFGWMVGNHESWIRTSLLPILRAKWEELCNEEPGLKKSLVEYISFKTGNKNIIFPIKS